MKLRFIIRKWLWDDFWKKIVCLFVVIGICFPYVPIQDPYLSYYLELFVAMYFFVYEVRDIDSIAAINLVWKQKTITFKERILQCHLVEIWMC